MTDSAPVTDNREVLTHNHIPEDLVARSRHSDGKIQLGEIRWQHRARDPHGNLLPDPPRFGDLLTPALDDLRVAAPGQRRCATTERVTLVARLLPTSPRQSARRSCHQHPT